MEQLKNKLKLSRVSMRMMQLLSVPSLLVLGLVLTPGTPALAVSTDVASVASSTSENPDAAWGIRIIGVRRTAADYMLDFRYLILDPDKAATLMDRNIKPYLIQEKSGQKLQVPVSEKIGPLRQAPKFVKANKSYFMFFANPGRTVMAGDKVTVVIGDYRHEHIIVE